MPLLAFLRPAAKTRAMERVLLGEEDGFRDLLFLKRSSMLR